VLNTSVMFVQIAHNTVSSVVGQHKGHLIGTITAIIPNILFQNTCRKKIKMEPANPGSPGHSPLKQRRMNRANNTFTID